MDNRVKYITPKGIAKKLCPILLPFLLLLHHLGLKLLRREGFLLRLHVQSHAAKFFFQFIIALGCCQSRLGALARLLIVIVVITLVEKQKRDPILGV